MLICTFLGSCESDQSKMKKMMANETAYVNISSEKQFYGSWKLSRIKDMTGKTEEELKKVRAKHSRHGLILNFFPDQILTKIEGQKYSTTSWNYDKSTGVMNLAETGEGIANNFDFNLGKVVMMIDDGKRKLNVKSKDGEFEFTKISDTLSNVEDDPFHPVNNQWRVVAPKSETYAQMKQRILNYTKHNHALFKATKERGGDKVVNANSIGIFVYYDGAIKIVDGGKVPSSWMANFYSPDEAMDAYAFMDEYFKKGFIRKKHPDGFVASGEVIFKELVEKMEKEIGM